MTQTYRTIREAAIAGTLQAMALGKRDGWEYGGVVIANDDGTFRASEIVTSKDPHGVNLVASYPPEFREGDGIPKAKLSAFLKVVKGFFHVHNHGERDMFSGMDLRSSVQTRSLAYMGDTRTGRIFEIDARTLDNLMDSIQRLEPDVHGMVTGGIGQGFAAEGTLVYGPAMAAEELQHAA